MPDLPIDGQYPWSDELRAWLLEAHDSDGSLKSDAFDVFQADANGRRIPLKKADGTVNGYLGYSEEADGIVLWQGTVSSLDVDFTSAMVQISPDGKVVYIQSNNGQAWMGLWEELAPGESQIRIVADNLRMLNVNSASGIDGTDTPQTVIEVADMLVNLGIAASHSVPDTPAVVAHGATAGAARPAGITVVIWVGSVEPTNSIDGDLWIDTSG